MLDIDGLPVDAVIVDSLKQLSSSITFETYSSKGANGHIFFGHNNLLARPVAVKYYYWAGDPAYHAEPRQLASVRSPNIIEVLNADILDDDWALFVTPYCKGGDLDDRISAGSIPLLEAVDLIVQILNGLGALHAGGFVHRDVKPQNILLNEDGRALIGDFGSVKRLTARGGVVPGTGHSVLYRPPESCAAGQYGELGDIYQCGLVLYQLLGGFLPYNEVSWLNRSERKEYTGLADPAERSMFVDRVLKGKITRGVVMRSSSLPPWVPKTLRRVLNRMCNVDPDKRPKGAFGCMAELHKVRFALLDWRFVSGVLVLERADLSYRVAPLGDGTFSVQKRRRGDWRRDNSFSPASLEEQVGRLEAKCCG